MILFSSPSCQSQFLYRPQVRRTFINPSCSARDFPYTLHGITFANFKSRNTVISPQSQDNYSRLSMPCQINRPKAVRTRQESTFSHRFGRLPPLPSIPSARFPLKVRNYEVDPWKKLSRMPLDLGNDSASNLPTGCLISKAMIPDNRFLRWTSHGSAPRHMSHGRIDSQTLSVIAVVVDKLKGDYLKISSELFALVHTVNKRIEPVLFCREHEKSGFLKSVLKHSKIIYTSSN